jgi:hypothetical protein
MSRNWWACTVANYAIVGFLVNLGFRDGEGVVICIAVFIGAVMLYDDVRVVRARREIGFE